VEQYSFVRLHAREGEEEAVEEPCMRWRDHRGESRVLELACVPVDAGPAAVLHSFALGG